MPAQHLVTETQRTTHKNSHGIGKGVRGNETLCYRFKWTNMFKCRKMLFFFFFFDQLNLGLLSLERGNRITAEVYKITNSLKKLSVVSDWRYSAVMTSSNSILGVYPCVCSDLLASVRYQHWQAIMTQVPSSFDVYFPESSPFFLTLQQQFLSFTAVYHAARKQL